MVKVVLKYVQKVRAKGKDYYYYRRGPKPWKRLPDINDPAFALKHAELTARFEAPQSEAAIEKQSDPARGTMRWLIRRYKRSRQKLNLASSTIRGDELYFEMISTACGNEMAADLTVENAEDICDKYAEDRPGTAIKLLSALSKLMTYAIRLEIRATNPCTGVERPEIGEHKPWPVHLLHKALSDPDPLFRRAVALHYYTGQRTIDACSASRNAIDDGEITVRQQKKKGKEHAIPLHPALEAELAGAKFNATTILENKRGGSLKPKQFRRWCQAWMDDQEDGGKFTPHGLRKNAVNALFEAGCSTGEIWAITDQSLAMIEHYGKQRNQVVMARSSIAKWGGKKPQSVKPLQKSVKPNKA